MLDGGPPAPRVAADGPLVEGDQHPRHDQHRHDHHGGHRQDSAVGQGLQEVAGKDEQGGHRDHHGDAGEHDGAPRGTDGQRPRLFGGHAEHPALPPPGDDEERIVDGQAEPDRGGEVQGEGRHLGHPGEDTQPQHGDGDGRPSGHQRHQRRPQRPEDDDEDQPDQWRRDQLGPHQRCLGDRVDRAVDHSVSAGGDRDVPRVPGVAGVVDDRQQIGRRGPGPHGDEGETGVAGTEFVDGKIGEGGVHLRHLRPLRHRVEDAPSRGGVAAGRGQEQDHVGVGRREPVLQQPLGPHRFGRVGGHAARAEPSDRRRQQQHSGNGEQQHHGGRDQPFPAPLGS
ncbi:hypothetical protein MYK68_18455 [Gordonia sp. PP30]|uniref:hypothetical protein n=1 Tax=Gordonia sp. PP30 TaxID=2935861 RepID=UPI001FFFFE9B|nr:hypothetical protein [Gordonia sp. PP30]UQE74667.1 hypothetical protein MYK68_18455 [Gordonia sp. PP30]